MVVHAFLDDSIRDPFAVCGAAIVDASRQPEAEACIAPAKARVGVVSTAPIHCREIGVLDHKHHEFGAADFRFWIDQDKSLTRWGPSRRQAVYTRQIFGDRGPGVQPVYRQPEPISDPRRPCLRWRTCSPI